MSLQAATIPRLTHCGRNRCDELSEETKHIEPLLCGAKCQTTPLIQALLLVQSLQRRVISLHLALRPILRPCLDMA